MDHAEHVRLHADELKSSILEGAVIYGADGDRVGRVAYMHGAGTLSLVIIDVGNAEITPKRIAVPMSQLDFMRDEKGEVHALTTWNAEQIAQMPEHHDR